MSDDKCPKCGANYTELDELRRQLAEALAAKLKLDQECQKRCEAQNISSTRHAELRLEIAEAKARAETAEAALRPRPYRLNYRHPLAKGLTAFAIDDGEVTRPDPAMVEMATQLETAEAACAAMRLIEQLRNAGASIEIFSTANDGTDISVLFPWNGTICERRQFTGDTLLACLEQAAQAAGVNDGK